MSNKRASNIDTVFSLITLLLQIGVMIGLVVLNVQQYLDNKSWAAELRGDKR